MTTPHGLPPRRGFKSRSIDKGTQRGSRGWSATTKHQVTGWRFQLRRIANGVARRDTRMLSDPLRRQGRSSTVGTMVAIAGCLLAFVYTMLKPGGLPGQNTVLGERNTSALFVVIDGTLHPVDNLASARLIVNKPDNPTMVKSKELDGMPRGNNLGIVYAPQRIVQNPARDARWMVCDAVSGQDAGTTVIAADPVPGPGHAAPLPSSQAILATSDSATWLIWGGKRSRIDLHNPKISAPIGINIETPAPRSINRQLLNLIPESPALDVPFIPNAGDPVRFPWPATGPAPAIGAVVSDHENNNQVNYFAVTGEGLQPIPSTLASILRANNAYGLVQIPALTPDQVAKAPMVRPIPVENYPAEPLTIVDPGTDPVTCALWVKLDGAPTSSLTVLSGQSLPISPEQHTVPLVASPKQPTATRVVMPSGSGFFVRVTGQEPKSVTKEGLYYLDDVGHRFGIEPSGPNEKPEFALGMAQDREPLPIPWGPLELLTPAPTLSKSDALIAH